MFQWLGQITSQSCSQPTAVGLVDARHSYTNCRSGLGNEYSYRGSRPQCSRLPC